eukprot:gene15808-biopygen5218
MATLVMGIQSNLIYLVTSCETPKDLWDTLKAYFERDTIANKLEFNQPELVKLGDGHTVEARGSGRAQITMETSHNKQLTIEMDNIFYVPKLACNLFSVRAVTQKGLIVQFGHTCCWIKDSDGAERRKLDKKANRLRFLGYSANQKGSRLFDMQSKRIVIRRDVNFNENDFRSQKQYLKMGPEPAKEDKRQTEPTERDTDAEESHPRRSQISTKGVPPPRFGLDEYADVTEARHVVFSAIIEEPATIQEAFNSEYSAQWKVATVSEFQSLIENQTWELVKPPKDRKAIGCKLCFTAMKRRQVKIRCKAKGCNSQFNSDYRLQHNREKHEGKNVPYETAGAVKNPFEAAKRKKDNPIEEKDSSSSSSSEKILDDKTEEIGLANSAKEESVSNISNVVGENVVDEESESEAENSENDDTDDENDDYWISCAGKLKHLLSTLEQRGKKDLYNLEKQQH